MKANVAKIEKANWVGKGRHSRQVKYVPLVEACVNVLERLKDGRRERSYTVVSSMEDVCSASTKSKDEDSTPRQVMGHEEDVESTRSRLIM